MVDGRLLVACSNHMCVTAQMVITPLVYIGRPLAPYLNPPGISQPSVRNAKGTFVSSDNVGVQDQSQSVALPVQNASRGFYAIPPPPLLQRYHGASPISPNRGK